MQTMPPINPRRRAYIPRWLTDLDECGPCPCGRPLMNQPYMIGTSPEGGKRWFHLICWAHAQGWDESDDWDLE